MTPRQQKNLCQPPAPEPQHVIHPHKAVVATARKIAERVYRLLKYGAEYVQQEMNAYEEAYRQRLLKRAGPQGQGAWLRADAAPCSHPVSTRHCGRDRPAVSNEP